jgi:hypothetical protein
MTGVSNAMNSVQSFSQQTLRLPREWTAKGMDCQGNGLPRERCQADTHYCDPTSVDQLAVNRLARNQLAVDQLAGGQLAMDWRALDWLSVRCLELDRLGAGWAARGGWFADVGWETGTKG